MNEAELKDAREELFRTFLAMLELSWTDRATITDSLVIMAADDLDDAVGELVDAILGHRRDA